jgi:hypothetical protein
MGYTTNSRMQERVNRFVGASKAGYVISALGMVALSAVLLYIAVADPFGDTTFYHSYEDAGWIVGPIGILFFGYCAWRGLRAPTDADGRPVTSDGKPLREGY